MTTKNALYTAGIAFAVVVLVQKYGHGAGLRHGA